jgi:hypothetical protein
MINARLTILNEMADRKDPYVWNRTLLQFQYSTISKW